MLLNDRLVDPEEVLFNLGFGGPQPVAYVPSLARIPQRFLQAAAARAATSPAGDDGNADVLPGMGLSSPEDGSGYEGAGGGGMPTSGLAAAVRAMQQQQQQQTGQAGQMGGMLARKRTGGFCVSGVLFLPCHGYVDLARLVRDYNIPLGFFNREGSKCYRRVRLRSGRAGDQGAEPDGVTDQNASVERRRSSRRSKRTIRRRKTGGKSMHHSRSWIESVEEEEAEREGETTSQLEKGGKVGVGRSTRKRTDKSVREIAKSEKKLPNVTEGNAEKMTEHQVDKPFVASDEKTVGNKIVASNEKPSALLSDSAEKESTLLPESIITISKPEVSTEENVPLSVNQVAGGKSEKSRRKKFFDLNYVKMAAKKLGDAMTGKLGKSRMYDTTGAPPGELPGTPERKDQDKHEAEIVLEKGDLPNKVSLGPSHRAASEDLQAVERPETARLESSSLVRRGKTHGKKGLRVPEVKHQAHTSSHPNLVSRLCMTPILGGYVKKWSGAENVRDVCSEHEGKLCSSDSALNRGDSAQTSDGSQMDMSPRCHSLEPEDRPMFEEHISPTVSSLAHTSNKPGDGDIGDDDMNVVFDIALSSHEFSPELLSEQPSDISKGEPKNLCKIEIDEHQHEDQASRNSKSFSNFELGATNPNIEAPCSNANFAQQDSSIKSSIHELSKSLSMPRKHEETYVSDSQHTLGPAEVQVTHSQDVNFQPCSKQQKSASNDSDIRVYRESTTVTASCLLSNPTDDSVGLYGNEKDSSISVGKVGRTTEVEREKDNCEDSGADAGVHVKVNYANVFEGFQNVNEITPSNEAFGRGGITRGEAVDLDVENKSNDRMNEGDDEFCTRNKSADGDVNVTYEPADDSGDQTTEETEGADVAPAGSLGLDAQLVSAGSGQTKSSVFSALGPAGMGFLLSLSLPGKGEEGENSSEVSSEYGHSDDERPLIDNTDRGGNDVEQHHLTDGQGLSHDTTDEDEDMEESEYEDEFGSGVSGDDGVSLEDVSDEDVEFEEDVAMYIDGDKTEIENYNDDVDECLNPSEVSVKPGLVLDTVALYEAMENTNSSRKPLEEISLSDSGLKEQGLPGLLNSSSRFSASLKQSLSPDQSHSFRETPTLCFSPTVEVSSPHVGGLSSPKSRFILSSLGDFNFSEKALQGEDQRPENLMQIHQTSSGNKGSTSPVTPEITLTDCQGFSYAKPGTLPKSHSASSLRTMAASSCRSSSGFVDFKTFDLYNPTDASTRESLGFSDCSAESKRFGSLPRLLSASSSTLASTSSDIRHTGQKLPAFLRSTSPTTALFLKLRKTAPLTSTSYSGSFMPKPGPGNVGLVKGFIPRSSPTSDALMSLKTSSLSKDGIEDAANVFKKKNVGNLAFADTLQRVENFSSTDIAFTESVASITNAGISTNDSANSVRTLVSFPVNIPDSFNIKTHASRQQPDSTSTSQPSRADNFQSSKTSAAEVASVGDGESRSQYVGDSPNPSSPHKTVGPLSLAHRTRQERRTIDFDPRIPSRLLGPSFGLTPAPLPEEDTSADFVISATEERPFQQLPPDAASSRRQSMLMRRRTSTGCITAKQSAPPALASSSSAEWVRLLSSRHPLEDLSHLSVTDHAELDMSNVSTSSDDDDDDSDYDSQDRLKGERWGDIFSRPSGSVVFSL